MGKRLFAHYFRSNLFPVMVSRFSQGTFSCTQIWSFSRVCKSKGTSPIVTFWHKNEITYSNVPYRVHVFTSIVREIDPLEELLQIHDWTRYCRTDMPGWKIYKRNTLTAAAAAVVAAAASSEIPTTCEICGHTPFPPSSSSLSLWYTCIATPWATSSELLLLGSGLLNSRIVAARNCIYEMLWKHHRTNEYSYSIQHISSISWHLSILISSDWLTQKTCFLSESTFSSLSTSIWVRENLCNLLLNALFLDFASIRYILPAAIFFKACIWKEQDKKLQTKRIRRKRKVIASEKKGGIQQKEEERRGSNWSLDGRKEEGRERVLESKVLFGPSESWLSSISSSSSQRDWKLTFLPQSAKKKKKEEPPPRPPPYLSL